jgi:hypothetical protein
LSQEGSVFLLRSAFLSNTQTDAIKDSGTIACRAMKKFHGVLTWLKRAAECDGTGI